MFKKIIRILGLILVVFGIFWFLLLSFVQDTFVRRSVVNALAPDSYEECRLLKNEDPADRTNLWCHWDVFQSGFDVCRFGRTGWGDPPGCYFDYVNPAFEFPLDYADCVRNYKGWSEQPEVCEIHIGNVDLDLHKSSKGLNIRECEDNFGFNTGDECFVAYYRDDFRLKSKDDLVAQNSCPGGIATRVRRVSGNDYLFKCDLYYNSYAHADLFEECELMEDSVILESVENSQWCHVSYEYVESWNNISDAV